MADQPDQPPTHSYAKRLCLGTSDSINDKAHSDNDAEYNHPLLRKSDKRKTTPSPKPSRDGLKQLKNKFQSESSNYDQSDHCKLQQAALEHFQPPTPAMSSHSLPVPRKTASDGYTGHVPVTANHRGVIESLEAVTVKPIL